MFCASLADVFDAEVDPQWRSDLWDLIRQTPLLDWLLLTKRPENIREMLPPDWGDGWPNVCLMTSVEDQTRTVRVQVLIEIPAKARALSVEPLLGPVELDPQWMRHLNWIIVDGESAHGARPMHPEWVRALRDQCAEHKVEFFFEQWGCWSPEESFANAEWSNAACFESPTGKAIFLRKFDRDQRQNLRSDSVGKVFLFHASKGETGNLLDGKHHLGHPLKRKSPKRRSSNRSPRVRNSNSESSKPRSVKDYRALSKWVPH